jgi:hypothetical protein
MSKYFNSKDKELNLQSQRNSKFIRAVGTLQAVSHYGKIMMGAFRHMIARSYG